MKSNFLEIYKAFLLTVIAALLLVIALHQHNVTIDGGRVEVTNTVSIQSDDPLEVHADTPLDVNLADQRDVIAVEIEK